jgi:colanic acid biosynthesis glycosyl transferase WcaI
VTVVRAFEFPYHGRRVLGRLLNYASFMLSAPIASLGLGRFDVIYVWHPPLTIGVAAWLIGRITRAPFVYDIQDIWPEAAILSGLLREGVITRALSRLERFVYRRAAHLLVVTEGARENLLAKRVPASRVSVASHWIDDGACREVDGEARDRLRARHGWQDRFVVLFAGNIGLLQALDTVLHAARVLRDGGEWSGPGSEARTGPGSVAGECGMPAGGSAQDGAGRRSPEPAVLGGRGVQIVLMGDGADRARLEALAATLGVTDRVTFIDRQPAEAMPEWMAAADVLLVHLQRAALSRHAIPTKTLAYLAAGRPIIMAMEGAAADLMQRAGAGVVVPSENPDVLAAAIREMRDRPAHERDAMGARGRAFARSHLTRSAVVPAYEAVLSQIAAAEPR